MATEIQTDLQITEELRELARRSRDATAAYHQHGTDTRPGDGAPLDEQIAWDMDEIRLRDAAAKAKTAYLDALSKAREAVAA
jgi:hypothetical protein